MTDATKEANGIILLILGETIASQMKKLFLKEYDYGDKKKITVIVWSRDGASQ